LSSPREKLGKRKDQTKATRVKKVQKIKMLNRKISSLGAGKTQKRQL